MDVFFPCTACTDLDPLANGNIVYTLQGTSGSRPTGTVATLVCSEGFEFAIVSNAVDRRTCMSNGRWTDSNRPRVICEGTDNSNCAHGTVVFMEPYVSLCK